MFIGREKNIKIGLINKFKTPKTTAKKMAEALEKLPPVEFTDKEWDDLMEQLKNDK